MNLGKQLHALGAWAFNHPWRIIIGWVTLLAVLGIAAFTFITPLSSAITIPGTKAQETIDRVGELFPQGAGATGRIVFHASNGTVSQQQEAINALTQEVTNVEGVSQVVSPFLDSSFISEDGQIAYAQVILKEQTGSIAPSTLEAIDRAVQEANSDTLQIEIGGDLVSKTPGEIVGAGEVIGLVIALLVLLITFGSLTAAGMPIISALIAVGTSMAGLFAMSQLFEINSTTPVLAVMLGLAVGIDYSLFIISKYRSLVLSGETPTRATAHALGTAGNAVVFAALTVIIALAALSVVNIPFMTTMGLVGAGSIAVAAVVSLTLTPSLLRLGGKRILGRKYRARTSATSAPQPKQRNLWSRYITSTVHHPVIAIGLSLLVVVSLALPTKDLTLGLPTDQFAAQESTERKAYDLLTEGFGVGFNAPLTVLVEGLPEMSESEKTIIQQSLLAQATAQQLPPAQAEKMAAQYIQFAQLNAVADSIKELDGVQQVQPAMTTEDGTAGILQVIPKTAPASQETIALIETLRSERTQKELSQHAGVTIGVTGAAALQDDINQKLAAALPLYLVVIIVLSLFLLLLAFRSIIVPVKATLGYLFSVLAMFGATVAVFQWGWFGIAEATGPIVSFVPIIAAGILFGLAMDYEFFLVSGMHEAYAKTKDAKKAIIHGFNAGAKVVTAAAIIMISIFAGFITNHETVIQSIGFALAVGILVDAFIVRMLFVPAAMTLLGKYAWWLPAWLEKRLPHISIEGEDEAPVEKKKRS